MVIREVGNKFWGEGKNKDALDKWQSGLFLILVC